jgi:hypothetical protein
MRKTLLCAAVVALPALLAGRADSAPQPDRARVLDAIPADAAAAVILPDLALLDAHVAELLSASELPPVSVTTLAKGWLALVAGVDETGGAAVVLLPGNNTDGAWSGLALLVPTRDFETLIQLLHPEPTEIPGVTKVALRQRPSYAGQLPGYTIFAPQPETVRAVQRAARRLAEVTTPRQQEHLCERGDISLWVGRLSTTQQPVSRSGASWVERLLHPPADMANQLERSVLNLRCSAAGLEFTFHPHQARKEADARTAADAGSNARSSASAGSDAAARRDSRLARDRFAGLPAEEVATAVSLDGERARQGIRWLWHRGLAAAQAQLGSIHLPTAELEETLAPLWQATERVAFSVSLLPDGEQVQPGLAAVFTLREDAVEVRAQLARAVTNLRNKQAREARNRDPRANALVHGLSYRMAEEVCAATAVDHVRFDRPRLASARNGEAKALAALGEGVLIRVTAVDERTLLIAWGGGTERFARLIETARSGAAPLRRRPGFGVAPSGSNVGGEMYVAADVASSLLYQLAARVGDPPGWRPITGPSKPIVLYQSEIAERESAWTLSIPVELIRAMGRQVVPTTTGEVDGDERPASRNHSAP